MLRHLIMQVVHEREFTVHWQEKMKLLIMLALLLIFAITHASPPALQKAQFINHYNLV